MDLSVLSQLQDEGIDTSCVVIAKNRTSGFTYIIVDQAGSLFELIFAKHGI